MAAEPLFAICSWTVGSSASARFAPISAPAHQARPLPVISTARTSSEVDAKLSASINEVSSSGESVFIRSGRLIVATRTPSLTSVRSALSLMRDLQICSGDGGSPTSLRRYMRPRSFSRCRTAGIGARRLQSVVPHTNPVPETWPAKVASWCETWGIPALADELTITLSTRFRTCLGRCTPSSNEIRVAAFLVHASEQLQHEVICHEAAHAAAHRLHTQPIRPHGKEWRRLMRLAGFKPRAGIPGEELDVQPVEMTRRRVRWEHRCPECGMSHLAGRPVKSWRCAACRKRGLDGRLVVRRLTG